MTRDVATPACSYVTCESVVTPRWSVLSYSSQYSQVVTWRRWYNSFSYRFPSQYWWSNPSFIFHQSKVWYLCGPIEPLYVPNLCQWNRVLSVFAHLAGEHFSFFLDLEHLDRLNIGWLWDPSLIMAQRPFKPHSTPPPFDIDENKDSFVLWSKKWQISLTLSTIDSALEEDAQPQLDDHEVIIEKLRQRCNAGRNRHVWRSSLL